MAFARRRDCTLALAALAREGGAGLVRLVTRGPGSKDQHLALIRATFERAGVRVADARGEALSEATLVFTDRPELAVPHALCVWCDR